MPHHLYRLKGSINWHISVQVKGRGRIRRSAGTPDKAKAEALATRIETQEWKRLEHGDPASTTFAEAVMDYVADGKSEMFLPKLVKHFKNMPLIDIKAGHIKAACRVLYPQAKPATWNRQVITPARAVINHAAEKEMALYIRIKSFPTLKTIRRAPDASWLPSFIAHAEPRMGALALFLRTTGARIGQAVAMDWSAFDLKAGTALIPSAKGYPERIAELTPQLVAMLANLDGDKAGRAFGFKRRWSVYGPWKATCKAAGIDYVSTHPAGRRGFATTMQRAGIDPKTAARRGGWASVKLMLDIYTDADMRDGLIDGVFGTIESKANNNFNRKVNGDK